MQGKIIDNILSYFFIEIQGNKSIENILSNLFITIYLRYSLVPSVDKIIFDEQFDWNGWISQAVRSYIYLFFKGVVCTFGICKFDTEMVATQTPKGSATSWWC